MYVSDGIIQIPLSLAGPLLSGNNTVQTATDTTSQTAQQTTATTASSQAGGVIVVSMSYLWWCASLE